MMRSLIALALLLAPAPLLAADGPTVYKRCQVCHQASGAGIPNSFPPLGSDFLALSKKPDGRRYLALAVIKGVSGPITVGGKAYKGAMPGNPGLKDDEVAAVLNHVGVTIAKGGKAFKAFTAAEVGSARASGAALNPMAIGKLHATVGGK